MTTFNTLFDENDTGSIVGSAPGVYPSGQLGGTNDDYHFFQQLIP